MNYVPKIWTSPSTVCNTYNFHNFLIEPVQQTVSEEVNSTEVLPSTTIEKNVEAGKFI